MKTTPNPCIPRTMRSLLSQLPATATKAKEQFHAHGFNRQQFYYDHHMRCYAYLISQQDMRVLYLEIAEPPQPFVSIESALAIPLFEMTDALDQLFSSDLHLTENSHLYAHRSGPDEVFRISPRMFAD